MKVLVLFILVLFALAGTAAACSCLRRDALDKEFADAENVAIMKLTAVVKADGTEGRPFLYDVKQSTLTVTKVYKGRLKVGREFPFMQGEGADCIWAFSEKRIGQEYLLFLGKEQPIWAVSVCSRSSSVAAAAADIRYLDNRAALRRKTRLYGTLSQITKSPVEDGNDDFRMERLPGKMVRVTGMGRDVRVRTDAKGFYEVYGLPPGRYRVEPEKIKGFRAENEEREKIDALSVQLFAQSHTEADFNLSIDNALTGRVVDEQGKPVVGLRVYLQPAEGKPTFWGENSETTENDGSFKFDEIDEGVYNLLLNRDGLASEPVIYPTYYYPSTASSENAMRIKIGPGDFLRNFIFKAPPPATVVTISGRLLFDDGSPGADRTVFFFVEGVPRSRGTTVNTDKNGHFSMRILSGQSGKLIAYYHPLASDYKNCPEQFNTSRADLNANGSIETNTINIGTTTNMTGIELKFPISICKRSTTRKPRFFPKFIHSFLATSPDYGMMYH